MNRLTQLLLFVAGSFSTALLIAVYLESQIAAVATWYLFFALVVMSLVWIVVFATRKVRSSLSTETHPETVSDGSAENATTDGLATLRERYARGELSDEQFERKLDRLLNTDTPEHADEWRERTRERIQE